jgi:hypothetical protein
MDESPRLSHIQSAQRDRILRTLENHRDILSKMKIHRARAFPIQIEKPNHPLRRDQIVNQSQDRNATWIFNMRSASNRPILKTRFGHFLSRVLSAQCPKTVATRPPRKAPFDPATSIVRELVPTTNATPLRRRGEIDSESK